jgi:NAD(P)-dependent dehydrogenase (short-subunit alcohol dehydrogenase family)
MVERGFGRIINMGSILSGRGMASRSAYAASKAGLANLGAALAFELGPHGVTVNTLGATVIVTDLNRELVRTQPDLYGQVVKRTPMGRLGELRDLTGVLVFLASEAAGFITGQIVYVDGGYTAG